MEDVTAAVLARLFRLSEDSVTLTDDDDIVTQIPNANGRFRSLTPNVFYTVDGEEICAQKQHPYPPLHWSAGESQQAGTTLRLPVGLSLTFLAWDHCPPAARCHGVSLIHLAYLSPIS